MLRFAFFSLMLVASASLAHADSRVSYEPTSQNDPQILRLDADDRERLGSALPMTRPEVQVAHMNGTVIVQGSNANACGASNCWTVVYRGGRKIAASMACDGSAGAHRLLRGGRWLFACGWLVDLTTGQRPKLTTGDNEAVGVFDHNGSDVALVAADESRADQADDLAIIGYLVPKPSIASTIKKGDVLFVGKISGENYDGVAYVYKKGCDPVAYSVSGSSVSTTGWPEFVLKGAAPIRSKGGCDVVGFRATGGNSTLRFVRVPGDEPG